MIYELNTIQNMDYLDFLKSLDDNSIDSFITSPPYWQLRDYGFKGQIGLEPKYQDYIQKLVDMMVEMKRSLKPEGTIWINLGDTYMGGLSGSGGDCGKHTNINPNIKGTKFDGVKKMGMQNKCLMLIPHRFAIRCVDELGLILRNDIIWAKRNGMPESATDRFSKKHEFIFFFVKQEKYYFDLKSIKDKSNYDNTRAKKLKGSFQKNTNYCGRDLSGGLGDTDGFKNPGDVSDFWDINTKPNSAKHYAMFNSDLIDKPIVSGCPKGGIICDPFCGTGTTLFRAYELNRNFIGNDGKKDYVDDANKLWQEIKSQERMFK